MSTPRRRPGRPIVDEITSSQQRTLDALQEYSQRHGMMPTMAELAELLELTAASIHEQVGQLVRKGYLSREPRKARSLRILRTPTPIVSKLVNVPIVGSVAAGYPIFSEENITGHISVEGHLVRGKCFALKVSGESMKDAGMRSGDLVLVRQQALAENGDIVVATVDGDATVKRLWIRDDQIELRPENPKYRPICIDPEQDFRILGKVVGVRKSAT